MTRISQLWDRGSSTGAKPIEWDALQVDMVGDLMALGDFMALGGGDLQETPVTGTVKINTTVLGSQFAPAIAVLSGGGYVIVWQNTPTGSIYAQRFNSSGQPVGSELHLDGTQGGFPLWVSVAATANDGFAIAFQAGSFAQAEIFGRRYDSANNPVGGLFAVNTTSPNEQVNPHITTLDNGGLLFTWDTRVTLGDDTVFQEIRGRIYRPDGVPDGNDFVIAPMSAADQHLLAAITSLPGGGFVATWQRAANSGTNYEIVGQRFTGSGATSGAEFQVNTQTTNNQFGNDVARLSDGGFVVTWVDPVPNEGGGRVVARHYDASGVAIGGEIVIDSKASGAYGRTVVTALANGGYVVSWTDGENNTAVAHNVSARAFGSNDVAQGAAFDISFDSPFGASYYSDGAVTLPNGNVVFAWDGPSVTPPGGQQTGQDIYMRVYSFTDTPPPNTPTEGDDILTDTAGNDTINALGGSDTITVTNGRDAVNGGSGNDLLILSWGGATGSVNSDGPYTDLNGGFNGFYSEGSVQIASRMVSYSQIERFNITTGSGADDIVTGNGNDEVSTGAGDDRVDVRGGVNIADGGADIDAISADLSAMVAGVTIDLNNAVNSGAYGSYSNFDYFGTIIGTGLADIFVTTNLARNDIINAGAGDDRIIVRNGADRVNAGAGTDTLVIDWSSTTQSVTAFQVPTANPNGGFDGRLYAGVINFPERDIVYTEVERFDITTGSGNDELRGGGGADRLTGGAGADSLYGNDGDDTIYGDVSDLVLSGGNGIDTLHISGSGVFAGVLSGFEALVFVGGANLTLTGTQFSAGLASNAALSGAGSLTVNMDAAGSFISHSFNFSGFTGNLTVNGTSGTDIFKLGDSGHTVNAGDGIDQIKGGDAADVLNGGNGIDKINGAGGADILTGGGGNDVFKYANISDSAVGAADTITDFVIGSDRLNFVKIDANAGLAGDQAFSFVGTGAFIGGGVGSIRYTSSEGNLLVQVDVDGNGTADMEIILQGIGAQTLTGGDFVL